MSSEPVADALDVSEGYGLGDEPGADHASWPDLLARIRTDRSWWVCTTRPDGRPHTMPVWGVVADDRILFSSDPASVKARNLTVNPSVVIHMESGDDVLILEGVVEKVAGSDLPESFVADYLAKYGFEVATDQPEYGFYEVRPEKVLAWHESDMVATQVRWVWP